MDGSNRSSLNQPKQLPRGTPWLARESQHSWVSSGISWAAHVWLWFQSLVHSSVSMGNAGSPLMAPGRACVSAQIPHEGMFDASFAPK